MKSKSVWLASMLLVLVTLCIIGGLGIFKHLQMQAEMQAPPPPEQPIAVNTSTASTVTFRQTTTMIGTVLAPRSIVLSNEIAGTVSEVLFEPGQTVEQGDVLLKLDTSVLEAQLESARARAKKAQSTFKRLSNATSGVVAPDELEEADAGLAQANAEVNELQAVINRMILGAPFRARIGLSDTHEGQFLPSGTEIVSLQSLEDYMYVDFMIPQSAAGSVTIGQTVILNARGREFGGKIEALDSRADRDSRNTMARARFGRELSTDSIGNILPGESVEVALEYGQPQPAVSVPLEALQNAPMQEFVYVVESDSQGMLRARERMVLPGPTVNGRMCILSGLTAGERVVAEGAFKLRDGALIAPVDGEV